MLNFIIVVSLLSFYLLAILTIEIVLLEVCNVNEITSICPFEDRYGSQEMKEVFNKENIVKKYIMVEKALLKALAMNGVIPSYCAELDFSCMDNIDSKTIKALEEKTGHEMASLAIIAAERCGECGKYVHLGATSNDIIDTAWALILREAFCIVKKRLKNVIEKLVELTYIYKESVMIGRTHGQHAVPMTFGFKLANYVYELTRSYERLVESEKRVIKGKMAGAVGTMAAWMDKGLAIEETVLKELGLEPHVISTQIAPRDGFAEALSVIAILASQLDRLSLELRELSRPEIGEISLEDKRIGSSTMPHKSNPVLAERVSGLARLCRGLAISALENIVLMHERDLTNSSLERIMLPHAFLAIDQMLTDTYRFLSEIKINETKMLENIWVTKGLFASECLMIKLAISAGVPRHIAHAILMDLTSKTREGALNFEFIVMNSPIKEMLSEEDIKSCFNPYKYLGKYKNLIERALNYSLSVIKGNPPC